MTTIIEPTEEQKQAARGVCGVERDITLSDDVARLLAEREHKLTREYGVAFSAERNEVDELRARIADLEAFTLLTDTERDLMMYAADPAAVTRAVRAADLLFESVGGSSRHYVNECLLPEFEAEGLFVIHVKKVSP